MMTYLHVSFLSPLEILKPSWSAVSAQDCRSSHLMASGQYQAYTDLSIIPIIFKDQLGFLSLKCMIIEMH